MDPHRDDFEEIGVFEAERYFSESSNTHGLFTPQIISTLNTQQKLKTLTFPKIDSTLDLRKTPKNGAMKQKSHLQLATIFNSFFHHSSRSNKKRIKSLESPAETPKSYPMSPQTSKSNTSKHQYQNPCNEGFTGDLWRDRRLEGITVIGKRWVLNKFVAGEEGLFCKDFSFDDGLYAKEQVENEDELSDSSSDLFELDYRN